MDLYYNIILYSDMKTIQSLAMTHRLLYQFLCQQYVWINLFKLSKLNIITYRFKPYQWINEYNLIKYSHDKTVTMIKKTTKPINHLQNGIIVICRQDELSILNLVTPFNLSNITESFIYIMLNKSPYIQIYLFNHSVIVKDVILLYQYVKIVDLLKTILYWWPTIKITNIVGQVL